MWRIEFIRDGYASGRHICSSLTREALRRSWVYIPLDQQSKTTTHQRWQENRLQHSELRTDRCRPWFFDRLVKLSYTYISNIITAGTICMKTKITRAPCRKRTSAAIPRAESFFDLITADHKVLSEGCESRNNHRYAVVVQDLATQWIQSYPCKTKTSQETQKSLQKFLEPTRNQRSYTLTIPWNLAKPVKN